MFRKQIDNNTICIIKSETIEQMWIDDDTIIILDYTKPEIQHDIKPTIDGETVSGAVHLNKAKEGNKYFLNKFELERTRPNGTTVKQMFYNNNRPKAGEEEKGQKVQ